MSGPRGPKSSIGGTGICPNSRLETTSWCSFSNKRQTHKRFLEFALFRGLWEISGQICDAPIFTRAAVLERSILAEVVELPRSCRTVALHMFRKVTTGEASSSEVVQTISCPTLVEHLFRELRFSTILNKLGRSAQIFSYLD